MIDPQVESRVDSMGYREVGDDREGNPYLQFVDVSPVNAQEFSVAWWRGWDRADAMRKGG